MIHEFSAGSACTWGRREEGQGGCVGSGTSSAGDEPFALQSETASSPPRSHPEAGAAKASPPPPPSQGLTRLIGNEVGDRIIMFSSIMSDANPSKFDGGSFIT